ncbi:hypothetical protein QAD02_024205 [Eretmocerus hayati]|uniref:Uncharacterized protein n=1 Tax=Eretmocerus hayati TaxID=131215 RepID=A0ACC2Q2W6_9HYME|nr:hypothetical protein QAD02_024205 [Eretmocerus hayati]
MAAILESLAQTILVNIIPAQVQAEAQSSSYRFANILNATRFKLEQLGAAAVSAIVCESERRWGEWGGKRDIPEKARAENSGICTGGGERIAEQDFCAVAQTYKVLSVLARALLT